MGIDARMLVRRVPRGTVTDEWLKDISWRLCQLMGANTFMVQDGLPPEEFDAVNSAWHAAFEAHRLYPELSKNFNNGLLALQIQADMGDMPYERRLAIERSVHPDADDDADAPPAGGVYYQDGAPIYAEGDECLLLVNLTGRYYGEGYERGDILAYCAIAEWLEVHIPGCEVWYGGDGILAEPFTAVRRSHLGRHFISADGRNSLHSAFDESGGVQSPAPCGICPGGIYRGSSVALGGEYASSQCAGCGKSVETQDAGKTWLPRDDKRCSKEERSECEVAGDLCEEMGLMYAAGVLRKQSGQGNEG